MKIADLFVKLGVQADQQALARFSSGLQSIRRNLITLQVAAVAGAVAIDKFFDGTVKSVVALQNLNNQTGLSIDKLQKWQQAAALSDITLSAEQVSNSIAGLQQKLQAIRLGEGNIAPFQILGLDISGDAFDVLDQLRSRVQQLDSGVASNFIAQLGLDAGFINALKLSNEEFEKLSQNSFLGAKGRADVLAAGTAITEIKLRLKALKDQAVAQLAPILTKILKDFFQYLQKNGKKISDAIASIARGVSLFVRAIGTAISVTGRFIENLTGMENGLKGLLIFGALLALSFSPFLAAITAVILILEDIAVWSRGGDSLFGSFYDVMSKIIDKIKEMPNLLKLLGGAGLLLFLTQLTGKFGLLSNAVAGLGLNLKTLGVIGAGIGLAGVGQAIRAEKDDPLHRVYSNVATGAGAGAAIGAGVGSFIPVIGTAIGAFLGAGVGGLGGTATAYLEEMRRAKEREAFAQSGLNLARRDQAEIETFGKVLSPQERLKQVESAINRENSAMNITINNEINGTDLSASELEMVLNKSMKSAYDQLTPAY